MLETQVQTSLQQLAYLQPVANISQFLMGVQKNHNPSAVPQ